MTHATQLTEATARKPFAPPGPHPPEKDTPQAVIEFGNQVKEVYSMMLATRNFEILLFWQRSNYFLVLNSALALGFFNLSNSHYAIVFALLGLFASVLWFWVCLGGKYWQTRWEQRLNDFERTVLPRLHCFSASEERIRNDVERGLTFFPLSGLKRWMYGLALARRPSVSYSMTKLAAAFVVAWAAIGIIALITNT